MGEASIDERATASCRLDWLSVSFYAADERRLLPVLGYFADLKEHITPGASFTEGAGRKFFTNSNYCTEAGIAIKWTHPQEQKVNAGFITADMRGEFFKYLNAEERAAVYLDLSEMEGYRGATRLDAQVTLIDPIADSEQIHQMVRNREIWLKGYDGYTQLGKVNSQGDAIDGASTVWGSAKSAVRCMTYNKAKEDSWDDVRAVRHEVCIRKDRAKLYFQQLSDLLEIESDSKTTEAEALLVKSIIGERMTYLNTSRFFNKVGKEEWPDNWAARSEPASFMDEILTVTPIELRKRWRIQKTLEDSMAAKHVQYGRKTAQWALLQACTTGADLEDLALQDFSHSMARAKDEDLEKVLEMIPEEKHEEARRLFIEARQVAAHNLEAYARETPA